MGVVTSNLPVDPSDLAHPYRIVARGLLDIVNSVWIGRHPGFTDVIGDTGVGDNMVHLAAPGTATMLGVATVALAQAVGHCAALAGGTLQDLQVLTDDDAGAPADAVVFVEVIETAPI